MAEGTVSKWYAKRGFGFVAPADGGDDVFAHATNIADDTVDEIPVGTRVKFDIGEGRGGRNEAKKLEILK